jgi:hypothetical protein
VRRLRKCNLVGCRFDYLCTDSLEVAIGWLQALPMSGRSCNGSSPDPDERQRRRAVLETVENALWADQAKMIEAE